MEKKDCPFCGSSRVDSEGSTARGQVHCRNCGASGPHPAYDDSGANWNTRSESALSALVVALDGLHRLFERVEGAMEHGTFRSEKSNLRVKDTPEWVVAYNALAAHRDEAYRQTNEQS